MENSTECIPASITLKDAAKLCHNLRKPITAIQAYGEILADELSGPLNEAQQDHVATMLRGASRMEEQCGSLYEFFESLFGRPVLLLEDGDLEHLCRQLKDKLHAELEYQNIRLRLCTSGAVRHSQLDFARIERAIERLLRSSIRSSPRGEEIMLSLERTDDAIRISIADNGPSLNPEVAEPSFAPFRDLGVRSEDDSGIGLFICQATVAAHRGNLMIQNRSKGGVTITIELPLSGK